MNRDLQDELRTVEEAAISRLRAFDDVDDGYLAEASVLVMPSFDDWRAYALLRSVRDAGAPAKAQQLIWRRRVDMRKLETPVARLQYGPRIEPTIEKVVLELPLETVTALLDQVAFPCVSPYRDDRSFYLDGTGYEVTFGRKPVTSKFGWWQSPPEVWAPLERFVEDVQAIFGESQDRG